MFITQFLAGCNGFAVQFLELGLILLFTRFFNKKHILYVFEQDFYHFEHILYVFEQDFYRFERILGKT